MKNTPEKLKALDNMVLAVKFYNEHCSDTGYQVSRHFTPDKKFLHLRIDTPHDDEYAAYPDVYFEGNWFGTGMVNFEIATKGYGDHSIGQAQRAMRGLECAIEVVKVLIATAEASGLNVHR